MGSFDLPNRDSPDLHLVVATRDELRALQHENSEEWRGALSLEAYLRREEHLYSQDMTKEGGMTPWMLVHQPDPDGPRKVLCGCETLRKNALVGRQGKAEDAIAYGICSVFCPEGYRGRGYAGRMMTELGEKLRSWKTDEGELCLFSVLYSDIGKDFYAARGWHPFPSAHVTLPASTRRPAGQVRPLEANDLPALSSTDEAMLRKQLSAMKTDNRPAVALLPDARTFQWHHAREEFVGKELHGKPPVVKGAIIGDSPGARVWAIWTRVWSNPKEETPNTLHILRLVVEDEAYSDFKPASPDIAAKSRDTAVAHAVAEVFRAAQYEATQWDMKEVTIWNPTSATLAAAQTIDPNVTVIQRETDSIASLQWYGSSRTWQDVDWIKNEKFGWC
ncbi:Hypothetical predicted protein [Lecanosticta acicola]|uniref:LYC1 C-terminal domain-containing protein n=1 Tax=Lecanosticta acicola TaxID=111012 RepID=A0AAI8YVU4_9PEZI|nr:Hypothetical predicted protein [Lecanosticta acicola]